MNFENVKGIFDIEDLDDVEIKLLEKLNGEKPTNENIVNASIVLMREGIYLKYPIARPEVVEALLLLLFNKYKAIEKEYTEQASLIKTYQSQDIVSVVGFESDVQDKLIALLQKKLNETHKKLVNETLDIARLIEQTLAQLYS